MLLRRIRAVLAMGFIWGFAWSLAGIAVAAAFRFRADAPFPIIFFVLGFFAGVIFSIVLSLVAARRRFEQMSLPRFAGWGAAGGVLLASVFAFLASLGLGDVVTIVPIFAVASAACASGSLALARRAARPELSSGEGGDEQSKLIGGS